MKNEHKASKAMNKAQAASKKAAAELNKANEEVEIKKRHTKATIDSYEQSKAKLNSNIPGQTRA